MFFHAEIRRNETLKNLSRGTVKRASVHEMLFSFYATYSPELPLCFSMKPVLRAPASPLSLPNTYTRRSASLHLAMCNGLTISNPEGGGGPSAQKASRKKSGLCSVARIVLLLPAVVYDVLRLFLLAQLKKKNNKSLLATSFARGMTRGNFTSSAIRLITRLQNYSTR